MTNKTRTLKKKGNREMGNSLDTRLKEIKRTLSDPKLEEIKKRSEGLVWDKNYLSKVNSHTRLGAIEASISVLHDYAVLLQDQNIQQDEDLGLKIHELERRIKKLEEEKNA